MIDPTDERLLHDLLDDRLDEATAVEVRARLETDADLRDAWDDYQRLRETLRREPGPRAPHDFLTAVRRRIALEAEPGADAGGAAGPEPGVDLEEEDVPESRSALPSLAETRAEARAGVEAAAAEPAPGRIRWRGLALAAAAMLVAAIGLRFHTLSRSPTPAGETVERAAAPRDERGEESDEFRTARKRSAEGRGSLASAEVRDEEDREAEVDRDEGDPALLRDAREVARLEKGVVGRGAAGAPDDAPDDAAPADAPAEGVAKAGSHVDGATRAEEAPPAAGSGPGLGGQAGGAPSTPRAPASGPRFGGPGDAVQPGLREPTDATPPPPPSASTPAREPMPAQPTSPAPAPVPRAPAGPSPVPVRPTPEGIADEASEVVDRSTPGPADLAPAADWRLVFIVPDAVPGAAPDAAEAHARLALWVHALSTAQADGEAKVWDAAKGLLPVRVEAPARPKARAPGGAEVVNLEEGGRHVLGIVVLTLSRDEATRMAQAVPSAVRGTRRKDGPVRVEIVLVHEPR